MGTLLNQKPYYEKVKDRDVVNLIEDIKNIQSKTGAEYYEVIQAYNLQLEITKADTFDEQMSGLGEIFHDLKTHIGNIEDVMNTPAWTKEMLAKPIEGVAQSIYEVSESINNIESGEPT